MRTATYILLPFVLLFSAPCVAQTECTGHGLEAVQTIRDAQGAPHQIQCWNPNTQVTTFPFFSRSSSTPTQLLLPLSSESAVPNLQTSLCPSKNFDASLFQSRADGKNYTLGGLDTSSGTPLPPPDGTLTLCTRLFINDSKVTIQDQTNENGGPIRNALFSIAHRAHTGTGSGPGVDDRAFALRFVSVQGDNAQFHQFNGMYEEAYIFNDKFDCNPIGGESCAAGIRATMWDFRANPAKNITGMYGIVGLAATGAPRPKFGSCNPCIVGVKGEAAQSWVNNPNANFAQYAGIQARANAASGNTNGAGTGVWISAPHVRFASLNVGLRIEPGFSHPNDFAILSQATSPSQFAGPVQVAKLNSLTACASAVGTCAAAPSGFVSIAAGAKTVTVSTSAVTQSSQIVIQEDSTLGSVLGVACNTDISRTYAITARTSGVSFTVTASTAPVNNSACLTYALTN